MNKTPNKVVPVLGISVVLGCTPIGQEASTVSPIEAEEAHKYTQTVKLITKETIYGQESNIFTSCNIAKVKVGLDDYIVGAKHCYSGYNDKKGGKKYTNDFLLFKTFQEDFSKYGLPHKKVSLDGELPKNTTNISDKNSESIKGENLKIIGCLENISEARPDNCFTIEGKASKGENGKVEMYINIEDQKMMINSSNKYNTNLYGMSVAPVFDASNNFFGILVENTHIDDGDDVMTLRIQPIRNPDGSINTGKIK